MKKIIVVYGISNVGKTTVINDIYDNLIKNGAVVKTPKTQQGKYPNDFDAEVTYNGRDVALMSMGDLGTPVAAIIRKYQHSDVLVTAYNANLATLKSDWLKCTDQILVVRKMSSSNASCIQTDNNLFVQHVMALI